MKKILLILSLGLLLSLSLASCSSSEGTKTFTTAELVTYDGQNGQKAYIAVDGKVYDVTNAEGWRNGSHQGVSAGQDLTTIILSSPHGKDVLKGLKVIGTLTN